MRRCSSQLSSMFVVLLGAKGNAIRGMSAGTPATCLSHVSNLPTNSKLAPLCSSTYFTVSAPFCRENRNRGTASHPNCQFRHKEMGTVFRQNSDSSAWLKIQTAQMCCHSPCLVQRLRPRVVDDLGVPYRLREVNAFWMIGFVLVHIVKQSWYCL